MSVKNVFKCRMPSMNYVFQSGKYAQFLEGVFMTDIKQEILELENEIKSGHPFFYIDPDNATFDTSLQEKINDAMAEAKLQVLKEHEQQEAASKTIAPAELSKIVVNKA